MKKLICGLCICTILLLTACSTSGPEALPNNDTKIEITHNSYSGLESKPNPYTKPQLNENLVNQYFDYNTYNQKQSYVLENVNSTIDNAEKLITYQEYLYQNAIFSYYNLNTNWQAEINNYELNLYNNLFYYNNYYHNKIQY